MRNIEMFFVLAVALFFFFIYVLLSADPAFGLKQTFQLFGVFALICAAGAYLIRRVTRKKAGSVDERRLTYLNLDSADESTATNNADRIKGRPGEQETVEPKDSLKQLEKRD